VNATWEYYERLSSKCVHFANSLKLDAVWYMLYFYRSESVNKNTKMKAVIYKAESIYT